MIDYCEYTPSLTLQAFVECFWTLKAPMGWLSRREVIIPGGRVEIIFNFESPLLFYHPQLPASGLKCQGADLLGQRDRYYLVDNPGATDLFGVRFRHGGLVSFTNIPADSFLNQLVPLTVIVGPVAQSWADQLSQADTSKKRVEAMESILVARLRVNSDLKDALRLIVAVKQGYTHQSMQHLCDQTGIHYKKMERIFTHYTGYRPKNFCRIIRFYRLLQEMKHSPTSLTQLGLQYGYYDQSHFIRDFREFTGASPTRFHSQGTTIADFLLQSVHV